MNYIEIVKIDQDRYYIEESSDLKIETLFWSLVREINEKKLFPLMDSEKKSLFAFPSSEIKIIRIISKDELPLTRKTPFVKLMRDEERGNY